MAGTIKLNYEETLKAARDIESLKDLIEDASKLAKTSHGQLGECAGEAVDKAVHAFERLEGYFSELKGWDTELAYKFEWAASKMTNADEKAAKKIEADFTAPTGTKSQKGKTST